MNLRKKYNVTKVFVATLVIAGVLTAVKASAAVGDGGIYSEVIM